MNELDDDESCELHAMGHVYHDSRGPPILS